MRIEDWLDSQLGIDIWSKKYQFENENFDDWLNRVSNGNNEVRQLIIDKKFLFGGRILANRGLQKIGKKVSFSNCYVVESPRDDLSSIFEAGKKLAITYSVGGGCGVDISKLAPAGAKVRNAAEESSGAVSFMDFYNMVTGLIAQKGRRGALMISMECNHPDIEQFIHSKSELGKVEKANISVKVSTEFMHAVKSGSGFLLSFYRPETDEYIDKMVNAPHMFKEICSEV